MRFELPQCENCWDLGPKFEMRGPLAWEGRVKIAKTLLFCETCKMRWLESPTTVEHVQEMKKILYGHNLVGCCMHVALDDFNLDTKSIEMCIEFAEDAGHGFCAQLGTQLKKLTLEERYAVCGLPPTGPSY